LLSWSNFRRVLIAVLLILAINLYGSYLNRCLPLVAVLRFSPIVSEAIVLANEHQGALQLLGSPIEIGWFVKGYINDIGSYSGESRLSIPVSGPKNTGTLVLQAGNGQGPWILTELKLSRDSGENVDLFDHPPDQKPKMVATTRRVFLTPLGVVGDLGLGSLPQYYREKYGLSVEILAPLTLDSSVRDAESGRLIAEELEELMKRRLPHLTNDESAVLIGITDEDMYIRDLGLSSMYNSYAIRGRLGVVSTFLLEFQRDLLQENSELVRTRVRKLVSRDIGIMAFQLPQTSDPTSVLARTIGPVPNIDLVTESFEGLGPRAIVDQYRVARDAPSYESELLPVDSKRKPTMRDGRYPCLLMRRNQSDGTASAGFTVVIDKCQQKLSLDSNVDEIEIDLRSGEVKARKTDFVIPGNLPVAVTRCYGVWDMTPRAFGGNTSLSWDMYPFVEQHPYTHVDLFLCDGSKIRYERISKGSGYADALYEHRLTQTSFSGSRIRWTANGWNLKQPDGTNVLFPGTQHAVRGVDGAMLEFQGPNGQPVGIERDRRRNLKRIKATGQRQINFEYDSRYRIIKAFDDKGKLIDYAYDAAGRLIQVRGPGSTQRFEYVAEDLTSIYENGRRLVGFRYLLGRFQDVSLADGRNYKMSYERDSQDKSKILRTYLTLPDGGVRRFELNTE
jgi:YD repeat-containing protein